MSLLLTEPGATSPVKLDIPSIEAWLIERVARYLRLSPDEISPNTQLDEIGLDSVYALTLCGEIEDGMGLVVEPTIAWDYPTAGAIARQLYERLQAR